MNNEKQDVFYFQVTDIWKRFCELHTTLFDLTCDEYSLLLGSEIDDLNLKVDEKQGVIDEISSLEKLREDLIKSINETLSEEASIDSVSELLAYFENFDVEKKGKHLFRFNQLLIDVIEKIQAQNKKNQLFINKAILSLQSIREEAAGLKNYSTYTQKATTAKIHIQG